MPHTVTEQELTEIEQRYQDANEGFPRDKLTFYTHAYEDVPRLIAALRAARQQQADPLRQATPQLLDSLSLFLEFNDQWLVTIDSHADREHDRITQLARAAIAQAKGAVA